MPWWEVLFEEDMMYGFDLELKFPKNVRMELDFQTCDSATLTLQIDHSYISVIMIKPEASSTTMTSYLLAVIPSCSPSLELAKKCSSTRSAQ